MQQIYMDRLCPSVRRFVKEVETKSGVTIEVVTMPEQNIAGPEGKGGLRVEIEASHAKIFAPTNDYFPDGAVRHEALHVHRLHIEGVPRLALAEDVDWDPLFQKYLCQVDNCLEHLVIVPIELSLHPERRVHWEKDMSRIWRIDITNESSHLNRRIGACLNWAFLKLVLVDSPTLDYAENLMLSNAIMDEAESFCSHLELRHGDKLSIINMFFEWFIELDRKRVAIEYLNVYDGSRLSPIPN